VRSQPEGFLSGQRSVQTLQYDVLGQLTRPTKASLIVSQKNRLTGEDVVYAMTITVERRLVVSSFLSRLMIILIVQAVRVFQNQRYEAFYIFEAVIIAVVACMFTGLTHPFGKIQTTKANIS
jgi:hypothetical protein